MVPKDLVGFFLSNHQIQLIDVMSLLKDKFVHLKDIEENLNLSKKKTKVLVNIFVEEVDNITLDMDGIKVICNNNTLFFDKKIDDNIFMLVSKRFKEQYIKTSALYNFLMFTLEKRTFQIDEARDVLMYSKSYFYKLINKLKKFFHLLNAEVNINGSGSGIYEIVGDEGSIRMLHYLVILSGNSEDTWMFNEVEQEEVVALLNCLDGIQYTNLSPANQLKSNILLAVYMNAIDKGYNISKIDKDVIKVWINIFQEKSIDLCLSSYLEKQNGKQKINKHEIIHISFMANYLIPELLSEFDSLNFGIEIQKNDDNPICLSSVQLLKVVANEHKISTKSCHRTLYQVATRYIVMSYLAFYRYDRYIKEECELLTSNSKIIGDIIDEVFLKIVPTASYHVLKHNLLSILTLSICRETYVSQKQKVYIEFSSRPELKVLLENVIVQKYNKKMIEIVTEYSKANIVISDRYPISTDKKYLYFCDSFSLTDLFILENSLTNILYSRLI